MTENEIIEQLKVFSEWNLEDQWIEAEDMEELINSCAKFFEEMQKYREIGTVDECRIAMEKQTKKKRIEVRPCPYKSMHYYQCPLCGKSISINANFCDECGQAIDRGDIN